jgi:hypothetical protein
LSVEQRVTWWRQLTASVDATLTIVSLLWYVSLSMSLMVLGIWQDAFYVIPAVFLQQAMVLWGWVGWLVVLWRSEPWGRLRIVAASALLVAGPVTVMLSLIVIGASAAGINPIIHPGWMIVFGGFCGGVMLSRICFSVFLRWICSNRVGATG